MTTIKRFVFYCLVSLISVLLTLTSCKKDDPELSELDMHINNFIWENMNLYYLWTKEVPNLNITESKLNSFLNKYSDHEKLFYDFLYKYNEVDKFSWIVDDYTELQNTFAGISLSMGYDFRLATIGDTKDVFGFVRYIVKGSPADLAGIKRGDIFIKINDKQLNTSNYIELLNQNSYSVSFATIANRTIVPNGRKVNLTAVEIHENPIFLDTIYNLGGKKVAYLVYNMFNDEYDIQLNNVFKRFKEQGVNELVLDLRYNSGGSINTAIYLSSMIYSTDTNKIYCKNSYNTGLQAYLNQTYGPDYFNLKFADKIKESDTDPGIVINSLGLSRVFILTSDNTASASELVINGLKSYISVVTVGDTTFGKYVGSATLMDYDDDGNLNTKHKWALQPIILKFANANGETDFVNGLPPSIFKEEEIDNLLALGSMNESLLSLAISRISGGTKKSAVRTNDIKLRKVADSKDFKPHSKEMFIDNDFLKKKK